MGKIRILPESVANKIAAGEVVERPSSVVKELVENSIDAGARRVQIFCQAGGKKGIVVCDDGEGMDRDDVLLAFERHATSKVTSEQDLLTVETLGFRGEALPAIASVSRLHLASGKGDSPGTQIILEGGEVKKVAEAACSKGSKVEVRDLFFNVPARKKFLKSEATELGRIAESVTRYALAYPKIHFELFHGDRELLLIPPAPSFEERILQIFGVEWVDGLIPVQHRIDSVTITAFLSRPDFKKASRAQQYLFVNERPVSDRLILHAFREATGPYYHKESPALFILALHENPEWVDVNVHPTKNEVRFKDGGKIHRAIVEAIRKTLEERIGVPDFASLEPIGLDSAHPRQAQGVGARDLPAPFLPFEKPAIPYMPAQENAIPRVHETSQFGPMAGRILGQYRSSFILFEDREGLVLVDQHVAHERILYERILESLRSGSKPSQVLLMPRTAKLAAGEYSRILELKEELFTIGLEVEDFGSCSFIIRSIPFWMSEEHIDAILGTIARELDSAGTEANPIHVLHDKLAKAISCAAAVKANTPLSLEKMEYLIRELFQTSEPFLCPHGRPVVLKFRHDTIERNFGR
jgi:DNA mismatch repair protein MutL